MSARPAELAGYRETKLIDPFENFVGPLYEIGEKLDRRYAFVVDERHVNMRGVIHGGMLMTLAERRAAGRDRRGPADTDAAHPLHHLPAGRLHGRRRNHLLLRQPLENPGPGLSPKFPK